MGPGPDQDCVMDCDFYYICGQKLFLFCGKKITFIVWLFNLGFTFSTFQFQLWILSYFCPGLQWESLVGIVWRLNCGGSVGIMFLSRGCQLLEIDMVLKNSSLNINGLRQKFKQDIILHVLIIWGLILCFCRKHTFPIYWKLKKIQNYGRVENCGLFAQQEAVGWVFY